MSNEEELNLNTGEIRKKAEEKARQDALTAPEDLKNLSIEEIAKIMHDLRVFQIQLEMQNEELRKAQVEIDTARARYFDLYDLAPVGYITTNQKGIIFEANLTAANLLERGRSALIRQPITRFIHHEDQDIFYSSHKALFETGTSQHCELRMSKGLNRPYLWVQMEKNVATNKDGVPIASIIMSDITRRKQMEQELRESEKRFRMMAESIGEIFYLLSADGQNLIYINPAFKEIYGRSPDNVYENLHELLNLVYPADRKAVEEHLRLLGKSDDLHINHQFRIVRPDGEIRWLDNHVSPVCGPGGEVLNIAGITVDITEQKRAEKRIHESLTEKKRLFSEVHHRVANNMTVISSMLALQSAFLDQKKDHKTLIEDTQSRITSQVLIHELIGDDHQFTNINFGELTRRLVKHLKKNHQQQGRKLSFQIQAEDIILEMNQSVPLSLITNEVISNACKHAFSGHDHGSIEVIFEKKEDACRLCVRDDGVGVPDIDQLFNPKTFGLTIIHELTKQLNGELAFESDGKGLSVEVRFAGMVHDQGA